MTLPPTLTPQRGSAYIIVYLIPRMVLKIRCWPTVATAHVSTATWPVENHCWLTTLCRQSTYYTFGLGFN